MRAVGSKLYDVCNQCGEIIQINKFLIGDLHFCTDDSVTDYQYLRNKYITNKERLNNL